MTSRKAKTFEEKLNAILRYKEYTYAGWMDTARFLPKFAYLADDELEMLLRLGQEIEQYAASVAKRVFSFGELPTAQTTVKVETLAAAIRERYPYLDAERVKRLTAQSAYNTIT
jgi:hypothetical protein